MYTTLFLTLCILLSTVNANSDEYRLRSDISRYYDDLRRDIVPRESSDVPLKVDLGMTLIKILDFNEELNSISIYGWQKHAWKDNNLVWDPEDYGGITLLRMPSDKIWRPDIYLYSSLTPDNGQDTSVMAVVTNDGQVLFIPPGIKTVHCEPVKDDDAADGNSNGHGNATKNETGPANVNGDDGKDGIVYPEWLCQFKYGSWVYDGGIISLGLYDNQTAVDTSSFNSDTRYEVVSTSATVQTKFYPCCPEPYQDVLYEIRIRRN